MRPSFTKLVCYLVEIQLPKSSNLNLKGNVNNGMLISTFTKISSQNSYFEF